MVENKELVIILAKSERIITSFNQNLCHLRIWQGQWSRVNIWVGDDTEPLSTKLLKCTKDFFDGGFQTMTSENCRG